MTTSLLSEPEAAVVGFDFPIAGTIFDRFGSTSSPFDLDQASSIVIRAQVDSGPTSDHVATPDVDQTANTGKYTATIPSSVFTTAGTLYLQPIVTVAGLPLPDPVQKTFPVVDGITAPP